MPHFVTLFNTVKGWRCSLQKRDNVCLMSRSQYHNWNREERVESFHIYYAIPHAMPHGISQTPSACYPSHTWSCLLLKDRIFVSKLFEGFNGEFSQTLHDGSLHCPPYYNHYFHRARHHCGQIRYSFIGVEILFVPCWITTLVSIMSWFSLIWLEQLNVDSSNLFLLVHNRSVHHCCSKTWPFR